MKKAVDGIRVVEVPYRNMKRVYYRREALRQQYQCDR